ncbi:unnamed protein product [Polarella glacialis]|uniref:Uncharacterized protein n=1 Tax=Polarella glacialis TaxID=89957 RepID=A0A813KAC5_POLGL|nr:unnamed protein product [Polarella glacialis]
MSDDEAVEGVVCWSSWEILHEERLVLLEPGRLFFSRELRGIDSHVSKMFEPVKREPAWENHCVRVAFLHLGRALSKRVGHEGTARCSGVVRMYISHAPCIACAASVAQFVRFFPAVRLVIDFDSSQSAKHRLADAERPVVSERT